MIARCLVHVFPCLCHCFRACVIVAQVHQPLASPCSCASGACGALPSLGLRITGFAGINDGNSLTVLLQAPTCIADISQDKPTVTLNRINQERNLNSFRWLTLGFAFGGFWCSG